jgi:hypothetical protein
MPTGKVIELQRFKAKPLAYKWWSRKFVDGRLFRFDAFHIGEPDFHAYIVRYACEVPQYGSAWCWVLSMPRASGSLYNGWASSPHNAKRQVEACIRKNWF